MAFLDFWVWSFTRWSFQFVGGPQTLPWYARSAQGFDKADPLKGSPLVATWDPRQGERSPFRSVPTADHGAHRGMQVAQQGKP